MKDLDALMSDLNFDELPVPGKTLPAEINDAIYARVMKGIDSEKKKIIFPKKRFVTLLLAGILACTALFAGAAALFHWDVGLVERLKPTDDLKEQFGNDLVDINQIVSHDGITVTLKQMLGDRNGTYLIYEVTAPKNMPLEKYRFEQVNFFNGSEPVSAGYGCGVLKDSNPKDNTKTYFVEMSNNDMNGKDITFSCYDFGHYEDNSDNFISEFKDFWNITWRVNFTNISKVYTPSKDVPAYGHVATFESIAISPFSVTVVINDNKRDEKVPAWAKGKPYDWADSFVLHFKNGETIALDNHPTPTSSDNPELLKSTGTIDGKINEEHFVSTKIFDPGEVISVSVNGVDIPLSN